MRCTKESVGCMHSCIFVGLIGTLMTDTGMSEVLGEVFGGIQKMLSEKKFPQNVHALRMLVEEVLHCIIEGHKFRGMEDLMEFLEERS